MTCIKSDGYGGASEAPESYTADIGSNGVHRPMDFEQARRELDAALASGPAETVADRQRAARLVLMTRGAEALQIEASPTLGLPGLVGIAASAPATPDRRAFALLLVHALGVVGLVRQNAPRHGALDHDICRLAETAIASVLLRAGYPFNAATYDRIRFLEGLHATLDEHLRPFEPTFPPWLHGLDRRRS